MSFRVGHCHVDISWRWPHVKCKDDYLCYFITFITLLQMTQKNMLKYFQTLKGWISFRIITSDPTRLGLIVTQH